jgi:hypothetical protein
LKVQAEAYSAGELDQVEIVWKGEVIKSISATTSRDRLVADVDTKAEGSGWIEARAFERVAETVRFAHMSPVYVEVPGDSGLAPEDVKFFMGWIDRKTGFYEKLPTFRSQSDSENMLAPFRRAREVYENLIK